MAERLHEYDTLLQAVVNRILISRMPFLIGVAGPPAAGKSTLAKRLVEDLSAKGLLARYCPMDGFHLSNATLDAAGLCKEKGRIDTFDANAYCKAVDMVESGISFWWPLYSRKTHEPEPEGTRIGGNEDVFVIEGNYVFTNVDPWRQAAQAFGVRIFVDMPDDILIDRLQRRHRRGGMSMKSACAKVERTDMPNARYIRGSIGEVDIVYSKYRDRHARLQDPGTMHGFRTGTQV